jgi:hypothetical protein
MLTYRAPSSAPPTVAWKLYAEPRRWSEWAPHVRGAWGLGQSEVELGARGVVRLLGVLPVPAKITAKRAGCCWAWHVGPVALEHRIEPLDAGCVVALDLTAPPSLEAVLRRTYGPLISLLLRNLARVAAREHAAAPRRGAVGT